MALLEAPAAFSVLPGMVRLLIVLDPIVITLDIAGARSKMRQRDAIAFCGDDHAALVAVDRPGRVLNLIGRADRWLPSFAQSATAPLGWVAWEDAIVATEAFRSGDLILGPGPLPHATAIDFLAAPPVTTR